MHIHVGVPEGWGPLCGCETQTPVSLIHSTSQFITGIHVTIV